MCVWNIDQCFIVPRGPSAVPADVHYRTGETARNSSTTASQLHPPMCRALPAFPGGSAVPLLSGPQHTLCSHLLLPSPHLVSISLSLQAVASTGSWLATLRSKLSVVQSVVSVEYAAPAVLLVTALLVSLTRSHDYHVSIM